MKTFELTIGISGILQRKKITVNISNCDEWSEEQIEEYLLERANELLEISWDEI